MALDDVQTLLEDTDEQLALVFRLHDESAESGVMSRRFKPRIKNVVENQRSVLDYLAYEVHQRHGRPTKVKIYYPSPPTLRSSTPTSTTGCQACELRVPTWPRRSSATSRSPKNGCAGSPISATRTVTACSRSMSRDKRHEPIYASRMGADVRSSATYCQGILAGEGQAARISGTPVCTWAARAMRASAVTSGAVSSATASANARYVESEAEKLSRSSQMRGTSAPCP